MSGFLFRVQCINNQNVVKYNKLTQEIREALILDVMVWRLRVLCVFKAIWYVRKIKKKTFANVSAEIDQRLIR